MGFREWNRKKNLWLRAFKARAALSILDKQNPNCFTPAELPNIRKVLFLRHDNKLGDMIVSTLAFRELKKRLPQAEISVITGPAAAKIIENNPHVSHIFLYKKNLFAVWRLGRRLAREKFDLFIDMDQQNSLETLLLLRLVRPRFAFGFNRQPVKMYNITLPFDFSAHHVTEWHQAVFNTLGLTDGTDFNTSYDLFIPTDARQAASDFLNTLPPESKKIIFNPFAASKHRCFSFEQAKQAAEQFVDAHVILVGPPDDLAIFGEGKTFPANLLKAPSKMCQHYGIWASLALLAEADLLISPDTYIVHAAAALKKTVCALYAPTDGTSWYPKNIRYQIKTQFQGDFSTFDISQLFNKEEQ